jgi:hypothetical protein
MAATTKFYGKAGKHLAEAKIDWAADTIKVSLHTSSYTPNQDTDDFFDDATNQIAGSGGYTSGGQALTGKSVSYDAATNEERLLADNLTWAALTPSAAFRYAVIRKARGGAASADEMLMFIDFGADQNPGGSDFTIAWAATGVGYLLAA